MNIKLKEDMKPVSVFRTKAAAILRQVRENQRPVVITERGEPSAVVLDLEDYERQRDKMALMEAILEGERDVRSGEIKSLEQVFRETRSWLARK